ncbi:hypothetical protein EOD39_1928 [Acipenser ruthenus]|uniref:HAT C-terminal dimerisation domain-containing protein n=1 Tax=Acipenser ruthenus TaxID=7906 RepID=A0A444U5S6_ACIRT|nr:hypothetical protein EOD39_1928 [Acipenser ruthenus]
MQRYKGVSISDTPTQRKSASTVKTNFIQNILVQLDRRFPKSATDLVAAFAVLGLGGIEFIPADELDTFRDDKIEMLIEKYGEDKGEQKAHINALETKGEWLRLKKLLAEMALVLPIHTADVERGFRAQNVLKTAFRNRLASDKLNTLLVLRAEGPHWKEFEYGKALKKFRNKKERKIFCTTAAKK